MANEEKKAAASAKSAVKKTDKRPGLWKRVKKWFRDLKSELKKVVWPTPRQIVNYTGVALFVMAIAAVVLWGFDTLASGGVSAIITLVG
jgi:preprotein translocase subunit SecE